jgi:hypothetical protein
VPARTIGLTGGGEIRIDLDGSEAIRVAVAEAETIWATAIGKYFNRGGGAA